jgi:hypothetical protein
MKLTTIRIWVTIFAFICLTLLVLINLIPRGNFIGAPAISIFVYSPLLLVELFFLIRLWIWKQITVKALNSIFYFSLAIAIIFVYLFVDYLSGTS